MFFKKNMVLCTGFTNINRVNLFAITDYFASMFFRF